MTEPPQSTSTGDYSSENSGGFSPFYFALLDKQKEIGCSNLTISVAYGAYKAKKQEEIVKLRSKLQRDPRRDELSPFVDFAIQHVDLYIGDAEKEQELLTKYVLDQLQIDVEKHILDAAKNLKATKWYQDAWFGFIGNFFFLIFTTIFALAGVFGEKIQTAIKGFLP